MVIEASAAVAQVRQRNTSRGSSPIRILVLVLLFTAAALYEAFYLRSVSDGDIWRHLRTGLWMLQNHAVPRQGLFSRHYDLPWIETSWAYDVLCALAYKLMGLRAIPTLLMGFKVTLAIVTFSLAGGWRGNLWGAVVLSACAQYAIVGLQPNPASFSILFFGIELLLLLHSRRCGDVRSLFWLPPLFFLWANLHMQFVNGLGLLLLFLLAEAAQTLVRHRADQMESPALPAGKIAVVAVFSFLAAMFTPYHFRLLPDAFSNAYSRVLFEHFPEMTPMAFRRPQNFVLLLLAMAAIFVLGRQRSRDSFKLLLIALSLVLAFRVQRDAWLVVLAAIAVLADFICSYDSRASSSRSVQRWAKLLVAGLVALVFVGSIARIPGDQALIAKAAEVFPVKAADFIRSNHLPPPLYNHQPWGGFLIWYLPEYPVAIDTRINLYRDELLERYFRITTGTQSLATDPDFAGAHTILLDRQSDMAKALTRLPVFRGRFRVAYQDNLAVILLPQ